MVKLYITTDRTHRYNVRTNNKQISELHNVIKKKTDEVHMCIENNRQNYNVLSRTNGFNRMIYTAYSELYKKYVNLIEDFNKCRTSLEATENKLQNVNEMYENLEDIYNERVTECERLKNIVPEEPKIQEENKV